MHSDQTSLNKKTSASEVKCESCGKTFSHQDVIFIDGEYLCRECFSLVESSKDTH
jgi:formylmethanofuran dehydrogenase subunit E